MGDSSEEELDAPSSQGEGADDIRLFQYKLWAHKKNRFVAPGDKINVVIS